MSSLRFLKEYKGHQPGEVTSIPFMAARDLVKDGIAAYANGDQASQPEPRPDQDDEVKRIKQEATAAIQEIRGKLAAARADHTAEVEMLNGEIARLAAEAERLAAENADLRTKLEAAASSHKPEPKDKKK